MPTWSEIFYILFLDEPMRKIWGMTLQLVIPIVVISFAISAFVNYRNSKKSKRINQQFDLRAIATLDLTPEEFMEMRESAFGERSHSSYALTRNFAGIYILINHTRNMCYVGQATQVLNRVNSHFTGKGNGDVYADYKYGDDFTIRMIALENSGFSSLNELERYAIARYDAYYSGYNKTRGNS